MQIENGDVAPVKQANCSVRDSVGCSVRVDQQQGRRRQGYRSVPQLAADGTVTFDSVFLSKLTETLEVEPHCIVVIGLSADATKEMLYLCLSGLEGTEATRATWSVLVSQHRFSWVQAEQTDGEGLPDNDDNGAWRLGVERTFFAAQRACRPDRKVTYGLKFTLPRISSAMRLDVDGHPSDLLAASLRREELTKLSKRKAMSRADHLVGRPRDGRGRP